VRAALTRLRIGAARLAYQAAHGCLRVVRHVAAADTRGVRCVLRSGDRVLLVRHTYGDRNWALPGGRVRRGETPSDAARREISQELGLAIAHWHELGTFGSHGARRKSSTVYLRAEVGEAHLEPKRSELSEVAWVPVNDLPGDCSVAIAQARAAGFL
jgi:ADP-ribose pyrophosphatase YjhB (NUDIX family)